MQTKLIKLIDYLSKELSYYKNLLNYSNEKNKKLLEKNLDEISIITNKEEKLVSKIKDLEISRVALLKEISESANLDFSNLNMSKVAELSSDAKIKKQILLLKDELSTTLEELRRVNDLNTEMIKQSLEIINHTVKVMGSTVTNPQLYNKSKKDHISKNQQSFLFDKKI